MPRMKTTVEEIERTACLYWPEHLTSTASDISMLPLLLQTQDKFISVLKCSDKSPTAWQKVVTDFSSLSPNVFLKHLMVLTDIGGERLQRFAKDFDALFPTGSMEYAWDGQTYIHTFGSGKKNWSNAALKVDKSVLHRPHEFNKEMVDVTMLLLWGSSTINNAELPAELVEKCSVGQMLGKPSVIDEFVKQRYLYVSRITGGSTSNDLGHSCEQYAKSVLQQGLPDNIIYKGHTIEGISHNNSNLTSFDIVFMNLDTRSCIAIEISFQVTTNSVIERKAALAKSRMELLHRKGHKVGYVVDGSGNFQRRNAINTIIRHSDIVVNFSESGLRDLRDFISTNLSSK